MSKLQYNEITIKQTVILDGDPYFVLSSHIAKKDRQKASNQTKLKNLRTGSVIDRTFHQRDALEEAELEKTQLKYLYKNKGEYFFCPPNKPSNRMSFDIDIVSDNIKYIKENSVLDALTFNEEIMSIIIPIKVELEVTEAMEAVKGNTSSGATKEVTLETGVVVFVPMFINQGDIVSINTDTGEYSERVKKA